jgi:hypothetical protein
MLDASKKVWEQQMAMMDWACWRWEFARRNPEVKNAYRKALEMRERSGVFQKGRSAEECLSLYSLSPEGKWEIRKCEELGLFGKFMTNRDKSFVETLGGSDLFNRGQFPPSPLWSHFVKVDCDGRFFEIRIDFTKVRSISALKQVMTGILDLHWKEFYEYQFKRKYKPEAVNRRDIDYDLILTIGKLREDEKLKYREIAGRAFPEAYRMNPESAERNAKRYYDSFKELVNGGYRDLTYP